MRIILTQWFRQDSYRDDSDRNIAPMMMRVVEMALQFPRQKEYIIYCARNLRTGTVKWDWIVPEGVLRSLRLSGEWKLTGVKEYDGFKQNTLDCGT